MKKCIKYALVAMFATQIIFGTSFANSRTGLLKMVSNSSYLIVDRVEGDIVICENAKGKIIEVFKTKFKKLPKSGDYVKINKLGKYTVDKAKTKSMKEQITVRFKKLFKSTSGKSRLA